MNAHDDTDQEPSATGSHHHEKTTLCRIGTVLWKIPDEPDDDASRETRNTRYTQYVKDFIGSLSKDPRVTKVGQIGEIPELPRRKTYYPNIPDDDDSFLRGSDSFASLHILNDIEFTINVPKKNQPKHYDDDIPAEVYRVTWNGITLVVIWQQDDPVVPLSGGHIVYDILEEAAKRLGHEVYNQACTPFCTNVFMHTTLRLLKKSKEDHPKGFIKVDSLHGEVGLFVDDPTDIDDVEREILYHIDSPAEEFSLIKNISWRLMTIESEARGRLANLLYQYYRTQSELSLPRRTRLKNYWKNRPIRRNLHATLASVWLSLANMESIKRIWEESLRDFERSAAETKSKKLFEQDYSDDVETIASLDFERLENMAQQLSERLDSKAVVTATLSGAIAGGLAGGVLGAVATILN